MQQVVDLLLGVALHRRLDHRVVLRTLEGGEAVSTVQTLAALILGSLQTVGLTGAADTATGQVMTSTR